MSEHSAVAVSNLHVRFGKRDVLTGFSLDVAAGESVAITGPSGSGKSTILACVLGMLRPRRGSVQVCGTEMLKLSRDRRARFRAEHIGVVFQQGELFDDLTATENVALPSLLGQRDAQALVRADEVLERLKVPGGTMAGNLSGGEYQRTALARALVNSPDLTVADEPTGSLDAELRDAALDLLMETASSLGSALLLVTHDPAAAARADRTVRIGTSNA